MPNETETHAVPPAPADEPKALFQSKTIVLNALLVATVVFVPQAAAMVQASPELAWAALGLLNIGLRIITKQRVALFPDAEKFDREIRESLREHDGL